MTVHTLRRRSVLVAVGSTLGAGCLATRSSFDPSAEDWLMYGRDPGRTRYVSDADVSSDGVEVVWERSVGASNWLPPVVASGTAYCQYINGLFVLDTERGEGTKSATYGGFGRGGPMAVAPTTLYRDGVLILPYGETLGGYVADPESWPDEVEGLGRRRARWWSDGETVTVDDFASTAGTPNWSLAPIVAGDRVVSVHERSNAVAVIDPNDGRGDWRYDLAEPTLPGGWTRKPGTFVVDAETKTVVLDGRLGSARFALGIDFESGSLEWRDEPAGDRSNRPTVVERNALAAADGDGYAVEWAEVGRDLVAFEFAADTGDRGWHTSLPRTGHMGLAVADDLVYHVGRIEDDGARVLAIAALNRSSGDVAWERTIDDRAGTGFGVAPQPPTVAGDLLLVPGGEGLYALDGRTGEDCWMWREMVGTSGGGETARASQTPAVVTGDRIVVGMTLGLYGLA